MAKLNRSRPDLKLIQGGKSNKKQINWQKVYNVLILVSVLSLYAWFLTGR